MFYVSLVVLVSQCALDLLQYQHAVGSSVPPSLNERFLRKNESQRSFQAFGFGASQRSGVSASASDVNLPRRGSHINVNVAPTIIESETPEIRKYKKRFNSDILCASLWGASVPSPILYDVTLNPSSCCRRQPLDRNRKRTPVARPQWPGQR